MRNTTLPLCSIIYTHGMSPNYENLEGFTISLNITFHERDTAQVHEWTFADRKPISLIHPENESQATT